MQLHPTYNPNDPIFYYKRIKNGGDEIVILEGNFKSLEHFQATLAHWNAISNDSRLGPNRWSYEATGKPDNDSLIVNSAANQSRGMFLGFFKSEDSVR